MLSTILAWFKGASLAWKLAPFVAIVLLSVAGYVLWLRADNAELRAGLAAAERTAAIYEEAQRRTAESFARYIEDAERARALLEADAGRREADAVARATIERDIDEDPDALAPAGALADSVLDRLRELRAAGTGD